MLTEGSSKFFSDQFIFARLVFDLKNATLRYKREMNIVIFPWLTCIYKLLSHYGPNKKRTSHLETAHQ